MSVTSLHDWRIDAMYPAEREAVAEGELRALRAARAEDEERRETARAPPYPQRKAAWLTVAERRTEERGPGVCETQGCGERRPSWARFCSPCAYARKIALAAGAAAKRRQSVREARKALAALAARVAPGAMKERDDG